MVGLVALLVALEVEEVTELTMAMSEQEEEAVVKLEVAEAVVELEVAEAVVMMLIMAVAVAARLVV